MSLTNILTAACTLAVAGVVGHSIYSSPAKPAAPDNVVAYIGAPAAPTTAATPERDIVAELLAPTFVIESTAAEFGAVHFGSRTVTETDVAQAKREWQVRLDAATAVNQQAAKNAPTRTAERAKPRRSNYHPSGRSEDTNRTMFERSRRVRKPSNRTYGLPHRKRSSRRIRQTR